MLQAMSGPEENRDATRIRPQAPDLVKIPDRYRASIVILKGHAQGMEYPLTKSSTVIGRDKTSDIALQDSLVSRQHAAVLFTDEGFTLKDLGSTNGTMLNGKPVTTVELKNRDRFLIGDTHMQFILEDTGRSRTFEIK